MTDPIDPTRADPGNEDRVTAQAAHYLNPGDALTQATATVDFFAAEPAAIRDEANILFIGTPDISLSPNAMTEVHEFFNPSRASLDLSTARFFAITGTPTSSA